MTEYLVWDMDKGSWRTARTGSWRKAVKLIYKRTGFLPRRNVDVRPRKGPGRSPSRDEFESFMSKHF